MISNQKRTNIERGVNDLSSIDEIFKEVEAKLDKLELNTEEIITAAINADTQNEEIANTVKALCRLVDSLRSYNSRICELKTKLKEVTALL